MGELGKTGFSFSQQPIPALKFGFLALLEKLLRVELCSVLEVKKVEEGGKQILSSLQHCRVEDFDFH